MLDQSFSARNFRKIFDYENRKGRFLEGEFFPSIEELSKKIQDGNQLFRRLKKRKSNGSITEEDFIKKKDILDEERNSLKDKRDQLLTEELDKVAASINSKRFNLNVKQGLTFRGKPVYCVEKSTENYFALKQLQYNLERIYSVKQDSRDIIVPQLKSILDDTFPKYIVRTDIKSFYESIDWEIIEKKLYSSQRLTYTSKRIVRQILRTYHDLPGSPKGIPRGVGVSSYLAELYMKDFDDYVLSMNDLIYYARYVDDIIAVFSPKPNSDKNQYFLDIENELKKLKLGVDSVEKTVQIDTAIEKDKRFDYLGYTFRVNGSGCWLCLRKDKLDLYKRKIDKTISLYVEKFTKNPDYHKKLLIDRIRFMTGNVKLLNSKKSVLVGIYYSHKYVDDQRFLAALDGYMRAKIGSHIVEPSLVRRLNKITFEEGFKNRTFRDFTARRMSEITEAWKDA